MFIQLHLHASGHIDRLIHPVNVMHIISIGFVDRSAAATEHSFIRMSDGSNCTVKESPSEILEMIDKLSARLAKQRK